MAEVSVNSQQTPDGEMILGKFTSQEELAKAYQELEKKLGAGFSQTPEEANESPSNQSTTESTEQSNDPSSTPTPETASTETPDYGEAITSIAQQNGIDLGAINKEFQEAGQVSDSSREKLYAAYGKQAVDAYLAGVTAQTQANQQQAEQGTQQVFSAVGGEENWSTITQWAAGPNGDQGLAETFNSAIERGDVGSMTAAAIALKTQYENSQGSLNTQSVKDGVNITQGAAEGFRSQQEMLAEMKDPRYKTDPAFRAGVHRRINASQGFTYSG